MTFQEVFTDLRKQAGLSQSDVAERVFVTRQAVSRWEQDGVVPEAQTLLALSKLFGVSINTLLGRPRTLICQSCGMPLSDEFLAKEADGSFNEDYCKWCWANGAFAVDCTMEEMADICMSHMIEGFDAGAAAEGMENSGAPQAVRMDPETVRAYMMNLLPTLDRWRKAADASGEH